MVVMVRKGNENENGFKSAVEAEGLGRLAREPKKGVGHLWKGCRKLPPKTPFSASFSQAHRLKIGPLLRSQNRSL
jgi:hypothetical protein